MTGSVLPQVIAFITSVMKGFITSSQLVDSGAVVVKSAFLGERPHRRRHARCDGAVALREPVGRSVIGGPDPLLVFCHSKGYLVSFTSEVTW